MSGLCPACGAERRADCLKAAGCRWGDEPAEAPRRLEEVAFAAAYYIGRLGHASECQPGSDGECTCGHDRLWSALYPGTRPPYHFPNG